MTHICVVPGREVNRSSAGVLPELDPATKALSEQIGSRLLEARQNAGLSQEALAKRAKMTRTSYARIEQGLTNVTIDSLVRIANGLGLDVSVHFVPKGS